MKVFKITVIATLAVLIVLGIYFNWFERIAVQFSAEKYIRTVSETDYKTELEKEPVCIKDKTYKNKELSPTDASGIANVSEMHKELEEKYNLSSVASADTDYENVILLLEWLTEHTYYSGMQMKRVTDNTVDILGFSFDKPFTRAINCRNKAIAFADCLVAVGIKAYPVCMISSDFNGVHFTCMAYISELDKWCSFDPSFGCSFTDENGVPLGIFEIREMFLRGEEPTVNGYNFNGTDECFDVYMNGFLKYCISNLSTWENNSMENRDTGNPYKRKAFCSLIPEDVR